MRKARKGGDVKDTDSPPKSQGPAHYWKGKAERYRIAAMRLAAACAAILAGSYRSKARKKRIRAHAARIYGRVGPWVKP